MFSAKIAGMAEEYGSPMQEYGSPMQEFVKGGFFIFIFIRHYLEGKRSGCNDLFLRSFLHLRYFRLHCSAGIQKHFCSFLLLPTHLRVAVVQKGGNYLSQSAKKSFVFDSSADNPSVAFWRWMHIRMPVHSCTHTPTLFITKHIIIIVLFCSSIQT